MNSKKKWEELMHRREELEPRLQIVEETCEPELRDVDHYMASLPIDTIEALLQITTSSNSKNYLN